MGTREELTMADKRAEEDPDQAGEPEIEHQANTNQVRDEPVPASHDDERRPAAVERNEESAAQSASTGNAAWGAPFRDHADDDQDGDGGSDGDRDSSDHAQ